MKKLSGVLLAIAVLSGFCEDIAGQTITLSANARATLVSLNCKKKNEKSDDEIYITTSHDSNDPARLPANEDKHWTYKAPGSLGVSLPLFEAKDGDVRIELWEEDSGGQPNTSFINLDPHDDVGNITLQFKNGAYTGYRAGPNTQLTQTSALGVVPREFVITFRNSHGNDEGEYEAEIQIQDAVMSVNACVQLSWTLDTMTTTNDSLADEIGPGMVLNQNVQDELRFARQRVVKDSAKPPEILQLSTLPQHDSHFVINRGQVKVDDNNKWIDKADGKYGHLSIGGGLLEAERKITIYVGMTDIDGGFYRLTDPGPYVLNDDDSIGKFHVDIELVPEPGSTTMFKLKHTWFADSTIGLKSGSSIVYDVVPLSNLDQGVTAYIRAHGGGANYHLSGNVVVSPTDCGFTKSDPDDDGR